MLDEREIEIEIAPRRVVRGDLASPPEARGLIVVPCTTRRPRQLPYHRAATLAMNRRGLATLLVDCLTPGEKGSIVASAQPHDVADRLSVITRDLGTRAETVGLSIGYLATAEAAVVALLAAGEVADAVAGVALVGVPDAADIPAGHGLTVPVMLITNGTARDQERGERLARRLGGTLQFVAIPGSQTLGSGDPGPHKRAFGVAADWFVRRIRTESRVVSPSAYAA